MGVVQPLNRTLDQELLSLLRGVSLECLVCGEFVMRIRDAVFCPECRSQLCVREAKTPADTVELGGGSP